MYFVLHPRALLLIAIHMNARDAGDLIYILIQRVDKSLSISGTL